MRYTNDQKRAIDVANDFCDAYITEDQVRHWVTTHGMPNHLIEKVYQGDMKDYVCTSALGGADVPFLARATFVEQITRRAGATMPVLSDMTSMALLSTMREQSQKEIAEELLMTGGRLGFSQAFSEPNAGSDASAVRTSVGVDGHGIYLNGVKTFVSSGQFMPMVLVLAHDPVYGGADGGLSLWLLPIDAEGVSTYPLTTVGQEMLSSARIDFNQVKLEPYWQIQTEGRLDAMLKRQYELGRILVCASSLGLAEAAFDDAVGYATEHMIKGRLMSSIPSIQEQLVDMETMIRSMRLFVYDAASLMGKKSADEAHLACALMKRYVPDAATTVASKALQVFGGRGYTDEERVGRIWRDCRGNQIAQGADEIMTKLASKFITKRAMM